MIRSFLFLLVTLLIISCEKHENPVSHVEEKLPADFMFEQRAYPTGIIKTDAYKEALVWKKAQPSYQRSGGAQWTFRGPVNIGGRITDIEIPTTEAQTYYVGAASGGIFKTTDGGNNWDAIFDEQEMLSIGDIEISRNNNDFVWVGTGEPNPGGGSLAYEGDGVYKSEDGGATWESKGLPNIGSVGKILIDPNDDNTVFVAAMGALFSNGSNRGVYRTTDGGSTWEQKLFVSDSTGVIDMAIHPSNGNIVYAATWERIRRPSYRQYGGETSGLYRSTDGGENWQELTNGLPSAPSQKGRISINIARSNPNVLYARYCDANGNIQGVYRTSDGGDNWTQVNSSQLTNIGFHWWFRGIFVDPSDENTIYNVDFIVEKSTDGGNNWFTSFPNVHVDQHAMAFNESVNNEVLLGNDGGFYKSNNDGSTWTKDETLPITQFYRFHVDAQNSNKIYGGTQDNSTMRTVTGGLNDWEIIWGGDGFQPLVDPTNTNVIYALSQRGNLVKSVNNGQTFNTAMIGINFSEPKNWDTPIAFDPANSQTLYYGSNRVYRSTNAASFWNAISPDLTNGPYTGNNTFGTLTSIDISELNSNVIYAGTDDGNVWVTLNGGVDWIDISSGLPDRWVTKVLASRIDPSVVYVTYSGYRFGEPVGHVYRSTNYGTDWTDISTSLPDIPVNDIVQDENGTLYIATDVGVMASATGGIVWEIVGSGMPSLVVTDMHIDENLDLLFAATYGRSAYAVDISEIILDNGNILKSEFAIAPNPADSEFRIVPGMDGPYEFRIFDINGREIRSENVDSGTITINVSDLRAGLYLVSVIQNGQKLTRKLIIQ